MSARVPTVSASGLALLAEICRGDSVESVHYGAVAVADNNGRLHYHAGDPEPAIFSRSTLKPFQALPLIAHPQFDSLEFGSADIAMSCASHSGESFHVDRVRSLLERCGYSEADLACGTHAPFYHEALGTWPSADAVFSPLQHNCSGKHTGMLALAKLLQAPAAGYLEPDHAVQIAILSAVAHCTDVAAGQLARGTDGCSAPNYAMPLVRLARAYAWLAQPPAGDPFADAVDRIRAAMLANPDLVAGTQRLDTRLMNALPGICLSKSGAEAVHCLALPEAGLGVAIKVADGNGRALGCIVASVLQQLGISEAASLAEFIEVPLHNARGRQVGLIRPAVTLEPA
ncbi:MAG: asparaginase [Gammaproteobacteria bacterium]|nr:asparaginase [Gammaproteobacteria bacterium]